VPSGVQPNFSLTTLKFARPPLFNGVGTRYLCVVLWNMHGGGVNKLETRVQILEMFQGADFVLLTETWHFPCQHLPHVEGFDSLAIAHTVQLGRTKVIKHNEGVVVYFCSHLNLNLS
jgi:hypothetical protein